MRLKGAEFPKGKASGIVPKRRIENMTPKFVSTSLMIIGVVVTMSVPANAATVRLTEGASARSSLVLIQTPGMERRQDRRDTRQDCRQQNGLVGQDKRACKQEGRQN
jgi:hypothetical protein